MHRKKDISYLISAKISETTSAATFSLLESDNQMQSTCFFSSKSQVDSVFFMGKLGKQWEKNNILVDAAYRILHLIKNCRYCSHVMHNFSTCQHFLATCDANKHTGKQKEKQHTHTRLPRNTILMLE